MHACAECGSSGGGRILATHTQAYVHACAYCGRRGGGRMPPPALRCCMSGSSSGSACRLIHKKRQCMGGGAYAHISPALRCCMSGSSSRSAACRSCTAQSRILSSAYVSIRQHTSAYVSICLPLLYCPVTDTLFSIRQHTSAYVSIRQHTSAYVSIRMSGSSYTSAVCRSCAAD